MMSALFLAHGCTIVSRHEILMRYCLLPIKTDKNFLLIWSIYSRTLILCSRNLCFAVFFRSLRFPNIHNGLFTSIFCFQNFKISTIYNFRVLTEGTVFDINGVRWQNFHDLHLYSAYRENSFDNMAFVERLLVSTFCHVLLLPSVGQLSN
jgi:hypothetical protein